MLSNLTICLALRLRMLSRRSGAIEVYFGDLKFEMMDKSRCLQKSKFVNWRGKHVDWPRPCYHEFTVQINCVAKRTVITLLLLFFIAETKNQW